MNNRNRQQVILYGILLIAVVLVVLGYVIIDSVSDADSPMGQDTQSLMPVTNSQEQPSLTFRNEELLNQHYQKHGIEMGFSTEEEYEAAAAAVVSNPAVLHKTEAEDGDDVYYVESTNEFVIVSTDGYIRTYFKPDAGIDYYNRQ